MPLTLDERANLILDAGNLAGKAIRLAALLANTSLNLQALTTANFLKQEADQLLAKLQQDLVD